MERISYGSARTRDLCCWPDCFDVAEPRDLPLCEAHFREVGMRWIGDNVDLLREITHGLAFDIVADQAKRNRVDTAPQRASAAAAQRAQREAASIVYYIQIRGADRVKIGTTTSLKQRMVSLRADGADLLATEPGGFDVENARHRQFADERVGQREEFVLSDRLKEHISSLG